MKRISLASPLVFAVVLLTGCDREPAPERQLPSPPVPAVTPAEAEPLVPETAPAEKPAPEAEPELVAKPPVRPAKPVVRKKEPALPPGFVKIKSGSMTFAIARKPVTVAQLRAWAESEEGRRLPHLASEQTQDIATDLDWMAADAYVRWLSAREKRNYRLPTELEWLCAAQSGRIDTQVQRQQAEPPLWEWTGDCWNDGTPQTDAAVIENERCASRVLVGGEVSAGNSWGNAPMGARRPAASFRLVLETH